MKECEFWQKKQKLDLLMGQENGFAKAYSICQELWEQLCTSSWSQEGKWHELKVELAQIYASIIIETGAMEYVPIALERLVMTGEHPYSAFLQARIFWMQGRYFEALVLLEEYFQIGHAGSRAVLNRPLRSGR